MQRSFEKRLQKRIVPLGTDVVSGGSVGLSFGRLTEHVDVIGPTGCGKTQSVMLPLFQRLAVMPDVSVVAMTCKGSFATMCADFAISHGLTSKLAVFNPGDAQPAGFNPMRKNGWPAERHAKIARTAVLAARGQHSLDEMPQLGRLMYLSLAIAFEQGLGLDTAARLLRSGRSALRSGLLRAIQSEFLRESLEWFDGLKDQRQEELAASTLGRLENFVADPLIRQILTEEEHCIDLGDVIRNHKKLCIDLGFYNPLIPDDARTLGRLMLNTILAHKFATPAAERTPTVLLIDEAQEFATEDLAVALTLGREMKVFVVLAHQFPSQMKLSSADSNLFDAVRECCRTKIVFGGVHASELEKDIVKELMIDQFNPYAVKDEISTLECEPVESTRVTTTGGFTIGGSLGKTTGTSTATARGRARATSRSWGASHAHSDALSVVHSTGTNSGISTGETILPNGETIAVAHNIEGESAVDALGTSSADSYGEFQSQGEQESSSETRTDGTQQSSMLTLNGSWTQSWSRAPFHEYVKRRVVSSRTFQTLDEFLTVALQAIKRQPRGHFVVKVPDKKAVFVKAHYVREPRIPEALRGRALARAYESLRPAPPAPEASPTRAYQLPAPAVEFSELPPADFLQPKKK